MKLYFQVYVQFCRYFISLDSSRPAFLTADLQRKLSLRFAACISKLDLAGILVHVSLYSHYIGQKSRRTQQRVHSSLLSTVVLGVYFFFLGRLM